jgi:glycosyltransferase involved in cell wall biosynthesis
VSERVRFAGFRSDVDNVYGAADVVAVPSTQPDPFPNAALEAAAAGCCVVAANHGGLPEMLEDGVTGRLVTPGDPAALAAALAQLRADPAARKRLGAAAAIDTRERFAPARLLERAQALYDGLLATGG